MPRMSKTRKQEWALFLNERNRITYNELCRRCMNNCKQSFRVLVIECPSLIGLFYKSVCQNDFLAYNEEIKDSADI